MLIEDIRSFEIIMPQLMQYLKNRKYNINEFFIKFELPLQYIIIQEFLFTQYNIVLSVTPEMISVIVWDIDPFDCTKIGYKQTIYTERITCIKTKLNHCYTKLIVEAFTYIENTPF